MQQIAEKLNLKSHIFAPTNAEIFGPVDIETHVGKDRRYVFIF